MFEWLALVTSLPTENATVRMRAWRALKASGVAVLRDGVYLMPERQPCRKTLESIAAVAAALCKTPQLKSIALYQAPTQRLLQRCVLSAMLVLSKCGLND